MPYAKISPPQIHSLIDRPRLNQQLERFSKGRATWVAGPAGAGKTSLLATYLRASQAKLIWYQLDSTDQDVSSFFHYFSKALALTCSTESLPQFASAHLSDLPGFCSLYFRQSFDCLTEPCCIVLEDYHFVHGSAFDSLLKQAIKEAPDGVHLYVSSRWTPPASLAREQITRALSVLPVDELKLDSEETVHLSKMVGLETSKDRLAEILQWSGGWAAGLSLMLEHLGRTNESKFKSAKDGSFLFDYFAAEIFDRADERIKKLLLALAHLPQFTGEMAAKMSGDNTAGEMLERLRQKNAFTFKREGEIAVYYFHSLFQDFLVKRCHSDLPREMEEELKLRSARLLREDGEMETAVMLFSELNAFDEIERIVLEKAPQLLSRGYTTLVSGWISMLPASTLISNPRLLLILGKSQIFTEPCNARANLERAWREFSAAGRMSDSSLCIAAILHTYLTDWQSFKGMDPWIERMEKILGENKLEMEEGAEASAAGHLLISLIHRQPQNPRLLLYAAKALGYLNADLEADLKISLITFLINHHGWRGEFDRCDELVRRAEKLINQEETTVLTRLWLAGSKLFFFSLKADYASAKDEFERAVRLVHDNGFTSMEMYLRLHFAHACLSTGRFVEAEKEISKLECAINPERGMEMMILNLLLSWRALLRGDTGKAMVHADLMVDMERTTGATRAYAYGLLARAQAAVLAGKFESFEEDLERVRLLLRGIESKLVMFHSLLIRAYASLSTGQREQCRDLLASAFDVGKEACLTNTLNWVPALIAPLCAEALDAGIETEWVRAFIRLRSLQPPAGYDSPSWPWPVMIRTLGKFEVRCNGTPFQSSGKAQKKPLELLKLLCANGASDVAVDEMIDELWPEMEGDAAHTAFDSTLYRLRKLFGLDDALTLTNGCLSLNRNLCWLDVWHLERLASPFRPNDSGEGTPHCPEELFELYRGPFLSGELSPIKDRARTLNRSRFERLLLALHQQFLSEAEPEAAADLLKVAVEIDPAVMLTVVTQSTGNPPQPLGGGIVRRLSAA